MFHVLPGDPPSLSSEGSPHLIGGSPDLAFTFIHGTLHQILPFINSGAILVHLAHRRDLKAITLRELHWDSRNHDSFFNLDSVNLSVVGDFRLTSETHARLLDLEFNWQKRVCNATHLHCFYFVDSGIVKGIDRNG